MLVGSLPQESLRLIPGFAPTRRATRHTNVAFPGLRFPVCKVGILAVAQGGLTRRVLEGLLVLLSLLLFLFLGPTLWHVEVPRLGI